jgi:hypothetical protein
VTSAATLLGINTFECHVVRCLFALLLNTFVELLVSRNPDGDRLCAVGTLERGHATCRLARVTITEVGGWDLVWEHGVGKTEEEQR